MNSNIVDRVYDRQFEVCGEAIHKAATGCHSGSGCSKDKALPPGLLDFKSIK
jgi:hypothetical protein